MFKETCQSVPASDFQHLIPICSIRSHTQIEYETDRVPSECIWIFPRVEAAPQTTPSCFLASVLASAHVVIW